jgi:hypothetical protein
MNCRDFSAIIAPLLDGALPRQMEGHAAAHLKACPDCAGLLEAAERADPSPNAPPDPDWGAMDDALASAAACQQTWSSRLDGWLDDEIRLSRRFCMVIALVGLALIVGAARILGAPAPSPSDVETSNTAPDVANPDPTPQTPGRTVF